MDNKALGALFVATRDSLIRVDLIRHMRRITTQHGECFWLEWVGIPVGDRPTFVSVDDAVTIADALGTTLPKQPYRSTNPPHQGRRDRRGHGTPVVNREPAPDDPIPF